MNEQLLAATPDDALSAPGPWREFWDYFSANRGALIGAGFILLVLLAALFANLLTPHSPLRAVPRRDPDASVLAGGRPLALPPGDR